MTAALWSSHGRTVLAAHGGAAVVVAFVLTRLLGLLLLGPDADTQHFFDLSGRLLRGEVPYRDFVLEYPPASLWCMVGPRWFTDQRSTFATLFMVQALFAEALTGLGVWRLLTPSGSPPDQAQQAHRAARMLVLVLAGALLQSLTLRRTDIFATAGLVWALVWLRNGRTVFWAGLALGLGVCVKLFPALVAPVLVAWLWVTARGSGRPALRDVLVLLGGATVAVLATVLPVLAGIWHAPDTVFTYHGERPLQLESSYATVVLLLDAALGLGVDVAFHHHAFHLDGTLSAVLGQAAPWVLLVAVVVANAWVARAVVRSPDGPARWDVVLRGTGFILLLAMLTHKTLSPQYLAWVVPWWCAQPQRPPRQSVLDNALVLLACLLTPVLYPLVYPLLIEKDLASVVVLAVRNALLWVMLARLGWPGPAELPHVRLARPTTLALGMWTLFFLWQGLLNLRPHYNGDLLLHLRIGEDILRDGHVPQVDVYSGLVAGEPFVAHEWLAAVIFNRVDALAGGTGLTLLVVWLGFLMMLALWLGLDAAARRGPLLIPLFACGAYVMAARTHARPHVFSMLLESLWVYAMVRWREERRWSNLLWLLPLQVFWANVHGSFVMGPLLLGALALGVVWETEGSARQRLTAASQPLAMVAALAAAGLINPYGVRLYAFSAGMFGDSDYIRTSILEWRPMWDDAFANDIWMWVWAVLLVVTWSGLALDGLRRNGVATVMVAALTVLALRAARFAPDFVIVCLPVALKVWSRLGQQLLRARYWRPGVVVYVPALALMLVFVIKHGAITAAGAFAPLGTRFEMATFEAEADAIRGANLKGRLFNEYEDGAYLIMALHPDILPVMDMRIDLFGPQRWADYQRALKDPMFLANWLDTHRVDHVLLERSTARQPLWTHLQSTGRWVVVTQTRTRVLLTRAP